MNESITHNVDNNRFEIKLGKQIGYIEYELSESVINYTHTIVPRELGGQGLGTDLVKYGLAYARVHHLKVKPSCSFVAAMIEKNKIYQDLLLSQ